MECDNDDDAFELREKRVMYESEQQDTIDALVAALVEMKDVYGVDGRGYPRTGTTIAKADAALALARGME